MAAEFAVPGTLEDVQPFAGGHINESYLVRYRRGTDERRYLLQRLNPDVFPDPAAVMDNVARVIAHLRAGLERAGRGDLDRRTLRLVPARAGTAWVRDRAGAAWRLYHFIEGTDAQEPVRSAAAAGAAGAAYGEFHRLLADLPAPRLHETIPRFHDTPRRVAAFEAAVAADAARRAGAAAAEIAAVRAGADVAPVLTDAHAAGRVPERVVHNDAKLANLLFDRTTGEALCVVDLDTVMPGLLLFDFGDMARSIATRAAEDEPNPARVHLDETLFAALAAGYVGAVGDILTAAERELLVPAAEVIVFEQAMRFLTDHLAGDVYYRTERPNHNLDRARTQLKLFQDLRAAESRLARTLARL